MSVRHNDFKGMRGPPTRIWPEVSARADEKWKRLTMMAIITKNYN